MKPQEPQRIVIREFSQSEFNQLLRNKKSGGLSQEDTEELVEHGDVQIEDIADNIDILIVAPDIACDRYK